MNMAICWLSAAGGSQNFANYKKAEMDLLHIPTIQLQKEETRVKNWWEEMPSEGGATFYGKSHENVPLFLETFPSLCQNLGINLEPTVPV